MFVVEDDNAQAAWMEEESIGDSDLQSGILVSSQLGQPVTSDVLKGDGRCVSWWEKDPDSGIWVASGDHEDIWQWNDDDEQWGDDLPMRSDN